MKINGLALSLSKTRGEKEIVRESHRLNIQKFRQEKVFSSICEDSNERVSSKLRIKSKIRDSHVLLVIFAILGSFYQYS